MNELVKILATIRRPFQQEIRSGCKDSVVINGLGAYVQLWVKNAQRLILTPAEQQGLTSLANLFSDYEMLSPMKRREAMEAAIEQIEGIRSGNQKASSTKKPAATAGMDDLPLFQSSPSQSSKAPAPPMELVGKGKSQQTLFPAIPESSRTSETIEPSSSSFTDRPDPSESHVSHSDSQSAPPRKM